MLAGRPDCGGGPWLGSTCECAAQLRQAWACRQGLSYQVRCGAANGGKRAENGYCCQIGSAAANGNILKISPETAQV